MISSEIEFFQPINRESVAEMALLDFQTSPDILGIIDGYKWGRVIITLLFSLGYV